ncbi:fimbrial protein [Aeromonas simiae]|uniref:fimbrial protein n=1 Tax=Aeromonas simiae TaxID=218936 RepID=UPI0005A68141|nr:fimbrial protein [Aeromonas simiae]
MRHFLIGLLALTGLWFSSMADAANSCDVVGKVKQSPLRSLNLTKAFLYSDTVSYTYTTAWSGSMYCWIGLGTDHMFFFSGLMGPKDNEPFYVEFSDETRDTTYWVRFTVDFNPWKSTVNGTAGFHGIGRYQTTYTLTVTLLRERPSGMTSSNSKVANGDSVDIVPAVVSGKGGADKGSGSNQYGNLARNYTINDTPASGWSRTRFIAFERLTIIFAPSQTTCEVRDMTIRLPPVSLADIKTGRNTEKFFGFPIACSTANLSPSADFATRNISAWFASGNLLDDAESGKIIVDTEASTSEGIGITLINPQTQQELTIVEMGGVGSKATSFFKVNKGQDLSYINSNIQVLKAKYVAYQGNIKPGTVVATAVVMFGYD